MKTKIKLDIEKEDEVQIAIELCYDVETIQKIEKAKTEYAISRILKQSRLSQK